MDNLLRIALIRVAAHRLYMTELKGKNERIVFTFRPDAPIAPQRIPDFMKPYGDRLRFTAYGNPFFTYKYKKCNVIEKDAQILLADTEGLLAAMEVLLDKSSLPDAENVLE